MNMQLSGTILFSCPSYFINKFFANSFVSMIVVYV